MLGPIVRRSNTSSASVLVEQLHCQGMGAAILDPGGKQGYAGTLPGRNRQYKEKKKCPLHPKYPTAVRGSEADEERRGENCVLRRAHCGEAAVCIFTQPEVESSVALA